MLDELRALIQTKIQTANAATYVHTKLAAAAKAIEVGLRDEAVAALSEARNAEMSIMGKFRDEFEAFAGTAVGQLLKRLEAGGELATAGAELVTRAVLPAPIKLPPTPEQLATLDEAPAFPSLADFVAKGFYADTYEHQKAEWLKLHPPETQSTPTELAPTVEQIATLDAEPGFPSLAEFVAQGFYADTYEFQKAAWMKLHQIATPTPETNAQNAVSNAATSAGSQSA